MFVEKLTIDELVEFITQNELKRNDKYWDNRYPEYEDIRQREIARKYDFSNISNYSVNNGKLSFKINNNRFLFTDFDYSSPFIIRLRGACSDKDWIKFMSNKFGDEYKAAFLEYRQIQREITLKQAADEFDNQTEKYERELGL